MLNLRYRDERSLGPSSGAVGPSGIDGPSLSISQRICLYMGSIFIPYLWSRAHSHVSGRLGVVHQAGPFRSQDALWNGMRAIETAWTSLELVNYAIFILQGKYRGILERICSARLVYKNIDRGRFVNFEYLNRQLVWGEISELILFFLPLVDIVALKKSLKHYFPRSRLFSVQNWEIRGDSIDECWLCLQARNTCSAWCHLAPCNHQLCYYCLASYLCRNVEECPICDQKMTQVRLGA